MADEQIIGGPRDLNRRRCVFKIAKVVAGTAAAAATLYMAPMVVRIADEAQAKGSKRKGSHKRKGPSKRKAPSRRRRHHATRRRSATRR